MYEKSTIHELRDKITNKEITIKALLDDVFARIESIEPKIEAYVTLNKEYAYKRAEDLQARLDAGENIGALAGIPIAIKDNMCMKDTLTTCSSKILSILNLVASSV